MQLERVLQIAVGQGERGAREPAARAGDAEHAGEWTKRQPKRDDAGKNAEKCRNEQAALNDGTVHGLEQLSPT